MSDAVPGRGLVPHGTSVLSRDLDESELVAAPVLVSLDVLLIDELSDAEAEDDAFAAALGA